MAVMWLLFATIGLLVVFAISIKRVKASSSGPPRKPGLLHQLPLELRQSILVLAAPWSNRRLLAYSEKVEQSYKPLRVKAWHRFLPFSRLYQVAKNLPVVSPNLQYKDFQPPIRYRPFLRSLMLVNRQTHIDMLSTIATEISQTIRQNPDTVLRSQLLVDYVHHGDHDTVEAVWHKLLLVAHVMPRLCVLIHVTVPWNATLQSSFNTIGGFRMPHRRVVRSVADIIARLIQHGVHLENPTPRKNPTTLDLWVTFQIIGCHCPKKNIGADIMAFYLKNGLIAHFLEQSTQIPGLTIGLDYGVFGSWGRYTNEHVRLVMKEFVVRFEVRQYVRVGAFWCNECSTWKE